jgi:hypothetical protein
MPHTIASKHEAARSFRRRAVCGTENLGLYGNLEPLVFPTQPSQQAGAVTTTFYVSAWAETTPGAASQGFPLDRTFTTTNKQAKRARQQQYQHFFNFIT